jgi:two-component system sensor histidine kinase KdpD
VAIQDPENWIALLTFLISSLIASDLSNRARRRTVEANARKIEMERLYALSRAILTMDANQPVGDQIAMDLARICEIPSVAIYDGLSDLVYRSGAAEESVEARLRRLQ